MSQRLFTRFALWVRVLFFWLRRVNIDRGWKDTVSGACAEGHVVHVAEVESFLDYLLIFHALMTHGLEPPRETNTKRTVWLRPLPALLLFVVLYPILRLFGLGPRVVPFVRQVEAGHSTLLFLKRARFVMIPGSSMAHAHLCSLTELQKRSARPVILVPHAIFWSPAPAKHRKDILDLLLGEPNAPGIRRLLTFLITPSRAWLRAGAPVNLKDVLQENPDADVDNQARKASWLLHRSLDQEEKVYFGPLIKTAAQVRDEILYDSGFLGRLEETGAVFSLDQKQIRRRVSRFASECAADFSFGFVELQSLVLSRILRARFTSFVVDIDGIETIKKASKDIPCVLVAQYKTPLDCFLASYILYLHGVVPPHVYMDQVAPKYVPRAFLRATGAFFGALDSLNDPVENALTAHYMKKLIKDGHTVQCFVGAPGAISGPNHDSRFTSLVPLVEAVLNGSVADINVVPVAIDFDQGLERGTTSPDFPEEQDRARYWTRQGITNNGTLYFSVGKPISLATFLGQKAPGPESAGGNQIPYQVRRLGYRVLDHIQRACVVSPSGLAATAILSHHRRGLRTSGLHEISGFLADYARARGFSLAPVLDRSLRAAVQDMADAAGNSGPGMERRIDSLRGRALSGPIEDNIRVFAQRHMVRILEPATDPVIQVVPNMRVQLAPYRARFLHIFQREALLALSMLRRQMEGSIELRNLLEDAAFLSRLLKREFVFRTGDLEQGIRASLRMLQSRGLVWPGENGTVRLNMELLDRLQLLRNMVVPVLETYLVCAQTLIGCGDVVSMRRKDIVRLASAKGSVAYNEGLVTCREAVEPARIEAAIDGLTELGFVAERSSGYKRTFQWAEVDSAEELARVSEEIRRFVSIR